MIKSFRRISTQAKASVGAHDPDVARLDALGEQAEGLRRTVAAHCKALGDYTKSVLAMNEAVEKIYPSSGNLTAAVRFVGTNSGGLRSTSESPFDLMNLMQAPLGEMEILRSELKVSVMNRLVLRSELEHYTAKVSKLSGRTSAHDMAKLDSNRVKLRDTTEALRTLEKEVNDRLGGLEAEVCRYVDAATAAMMRYQCEFFRSGVSCYEGGMELSRLKKAGAPSTAAGDAPRRALPTPPAADSGAGAEGPHTSMSAFLSAAPPSPTPASVPAALPLGALLAAPEPEVPDVSTATPGEGVVLVQAVAPFAGASEVDLSFKAGDILLMTSRDAAGLWAHGRIGDTFGDFSFACVALHPAPAAKKLVSAMFDYAEGDVTEVSFVCGDKVAVICDENPSWWLGAVGGRIGFFPSNYVA